nr:cupin domain-containing protein [Streptomyces rimosus]
MNGLIVPPGGGKRLVAKAQDVTFKVTAEHSKYASTFEVVVPPGFNTGVHYHTQGEELFYILDGELDLLAFEPREQSGDWLDWEGADGQRVVRAGAGALMFVPPGCPHAFANRTEKPVKMLFQSSPPGDHEEYFDKLLDIFTGGDRVDAEEVARLREEHDVHQITPLSYG